MVIKNLSRLKWIITKKKFVTYLPYIHATLPVLIFQFVSIIKMASTFLKFIKIYQKEKIAKQELSKKS